jgi:hypothetical protein
MAATNFDTIECGASTINTGTFPANTKITRKTAKVVISSAELLALYTTPKELVAAPGAGKLLIFDEAVVYKPAGKAYSGIASGEDLIITYTDASGAQVNTSLETDGFLDQTTAQTRITRPIVTEYTPVVNAALVISLAAGNITTGDQPLYVTVYYHIVENLTVAGQ